MGKTTTYKTVPARWMALTTLMLALLTGQGLAVIAADAAGSEMTLLHRQSQIVAVPWKVARVAVTDPAIADVQVLTAEQVLIQGLAVGTTDIIFWSEDDRRVIQKKIHVVMDVENLRRTINDLFPTSSLKMTQSGSNLIVRGSHTNALHAVQLQEYLDKMDISFVDMTDVAGVQQVQLEVRVAEVSKTAIRSMGINWMQQGSQFGTVVSPGGGITGDSSMRMPPYTFGTEANLSASGITFFGALPRADLSLFLEALAENQYLRMLANPTLIALNGEQASFLAGGEYPIPVPQGTGASTSITIEYKEYGVQLMFKPVVLGDNRIRLYAMPEVSQLTSVGSIRIGDFEVPALTTRRAETTIELKSGQSFAIAGLLQDNVTATNARLPGLGDLPVLGPLFRSVKYQHGETELIVLVTVNLVEPLDIDPKTAPLPGFLHESPNDWQFYLDGRIEGRKPVGLHPVDADRLRQLGLDQLSGPGAWDDFDLAVPRSKAELTAD